MVVTPWGRVDELRDRMLDARPRQSPEEAARNQRERLFGAMVACCAERGYERTTVAELIAVAGVSRRDFYKHFADREACFLATLEEILEGAGAITASHLNRAGSWEERTSEALRAFAELIVTQPAAARLCLVEAHAAGTKAVARIDEAAGTFHAFLTEALAEQPERRDIPAEITRALIGGIRKIIQIRLNRGTEEELTDLMPGLLELMLSYQAPPRPLKRRRPQTSSSTEEDNPERNDKLEQVDPAERIVRATMEVVAERGYLATTIADIANSAGISLSTFYAHFDGKEDAFEAALYGGRARFIGVTMPVYRRARNWPEAIRAVTQTTHLFLASEPAFARVSTVDVYAAGPKALKDLDLGLQVAQVPIEEGRKLAPQLEPIAIEAIASACHAMVCEQVESAGAESLPEISALATYLTLCPFIGPEQACDVANGGRWTGAEQ